MLDEKYKKSLLAIFDKSRQTIKALETTLQNAPNSWDMTVRAGTGTLLGNIYMSVENILRKKLSTLFRSLSDFFI